VGGSAASTVLGKIYLKEKLKNKKITGSIFYYKQNVIVEKRLDI
jgi:hypothetical protein